MHAGFSGQRETIKLMGFATPAEAELSVTGVIR